ncbi:MAG: DNA-3-methyladenine glycosylase [Anaerolineae bacterium]
MLKSPRLPHSFFARETLSVARELLGTRLVHLEAGRRLSGLIVETEAYCGEADQGCHARAGRTPRTEVMYGPPGHAYVYFTYGMHWLFNTVTRAAGQPEAVLVRAVIPLEGIEAIKARRGGQPRRLWTDGPAKLTQALGIGEEHNRLDLTDPSSEIWLEAGVSIPERFVTTGPRVGLNSVSEPWKSKPWRFAAQLPPGWLEDQGIFSDDGGPTG